MKDIIIVEGKSKYEFNDKKEIVKQFLGEDFYKLKDNEKYKRIKLKTLMNATFRNIEVKDIIKGDSIDNIEKNQYIVYDEDTYLLSLAKNNDIVIYENEKVNQFSENINKEQLERVGKEYIRINDCANEILKNKLKTIKESKNADKKGEY